MNTYDTPANRQAISLAFAALLASVDQLLESSSYNAHPGYGIEGDMHLKAISEPTRDLFERLAGLAYAGLATIESDREWFLSDGLRAAHCYDFWYTLALTVIKAADGHSESEHPAAVPEAPIVSLLHSLKRFLPYACVQPGDCAMRTADALILLSTAFPFESIRHQLQDARFAASTTSDLLAAVHERVEESLRAGRAQKPDGRGEQP